MAGDDRSIWICLRFDLRESLYRGFQIKNARQPLTGERKLKFKFLRCQPGESPAPKIFPLLRLIPASSGLSEPTAPEGGGAHRRAT
jgi:hypothetical protein